MICAKSSAAAPLDSSKKLALSGFSHHDLGWHKGSFEAESSCVNAEINQALDMMNQDPDFTWTHEHGAYLYEYLKAYPERFEELKKRILEGRFEVGAGYSSPYTGFVTAEMLARQYIYGKKWIEDLIPGYTSNVFYNTDVPSLSAQMPQILRKSDIPYLYASRSWNFPNFKNNEFRLWEAPDGSKVNTFFMHHYGDNTNPETLESDTFVENIIESAKEAYENKKLGDVLPVLRGHDCRLPEDLSSRVSSWNTHSAETELPEMECMTLQNALSRVFTEQSDLSSDILSGEWPNKWFYENAASDHRAFCNQREAERYLRAAETLSVIRANVEGCYENYPTAELETLWRKTEFSCHGYAPSGAIENFRKLYEEACTGAKALVEKQLTWLASQIKIENDPKVISFAVYNNLSWQRDDVVEMDIPKNAPSPFCLYDSKGNLVDYQINAKGQLLFIAHAVPSFGYRTYYLRAGQQTVAAEAQATVGEKWSAPFSNRYYTVTPAIGGLEQIVDKTNGDIPLFNTEKFKIAELLDFQYDGMGAGEQLYMWQPHSPICITSFQPEAWECIEAGTIRTMFEMRANTDRGLVALRLSLYHTLKKIDFHLDLKNMDETAARQLRLMFPIKTDNLFGQNGNVTDSGVKVTYEVPFGAVQVGSEVLADFSKFNDNTSDPNDTNNTSNRSMRPREVQNWISAGDDHMQVTFSSYGLGWDYQDATENPSKQPVLQPVLLSTSKSCHGGYGSWMQPGALAFRFSMTCGTPGYGGEKAAIGANNPLMTIVLNGTGNTLPEEYSGLTVDQDNVIVTAMKKAEDDMESIVIRFYEFIGQTTTSVKLTLPNTISDACKCSILEKNTDTITAVDDRTVTVETDAWSIETIKVKLDVIRSTPSAPINLIATRVSDDVSIRWDDRNADTAYYVLEAKSGDGDWHLLTETEKSTYNTRLADGDYQFRVKAVSDKAHSQYSTVWELSTYSPDAYHNNNQSSVDM